MFTGMHKGVPPVPVSAKMQNFPIFLECAPLDIL